MRKASLAADILQKLAGEQPPAGSDSLVIHLADGSALELIVHPPADEPQTETRH